MRLLPLLYASWTLVAALEGRQDSSTDVSSRTQPAASSQTTLATQISSSTTPTSTPATTQSPSDSSSGTGTYTGSGDGSSDSGSDVDADAGASGGSSSSFNLSKGGLIAICIVVALVVIFGIASTVLFIIAKRRQWNIRASIRRASRRFTGRGPAPPSKADRQSKRSGVQMSSMSGTTGHKRGLVVAVQDVEKGKKQTNNTGETQKSWRNDGKR